jgi:hypothetical protein
MVVSVSLNEKEIVKLIIKVTLILVEQSNFPLVDHEKVNSHGTSPFIFELIKIGKKP